MFDKIKNIIKGYFKSSNKKSQEDLNELFLNTQQLLDDYEYEKAKKLTEKALEIIKYDLDHDSLIYADALNNLALIYSNMGQYNNSKPLYLESKEIIYNELGSESPRYATSLNNLANLYRNMGRYQEAESLYLEAKEIRSVHAPGYGADTLNDLANLYTSMGRYQEALKLYLKSKEIIFNILGPETHRYASALNNLANLYLSLGRYEDALKQYLKVKDIREKIGSKNARYADTLNNLAHVYNMMGCYYEAEPLYLESKEIILDVLGSESPRYAISLNNLANLYRNMGNYQEAEPLYLESKEIIFNILGSENKRYADILNNLANFWSDMGRYNEALPLYIEAKEIRYNLLGSKHRLYADTLNNLANLHLTMGNYTDAFELMKNVFFIDINLISEIFLISSETQRTKFLDTLNFNLDIFLSLVINSLNDVEAQRFAAEVVLKWKGLEMETSMAMNELTLAGEHPEFTEKFQKLRLLRDQHVQLILESPQNKSSEFYLKSLKDLENRIKNLESDLSRDIPELDLKKRLENVNIDLIINNIPSGAVLIDFIRFEYYQKDKHKNTQYLAFVFRSGDPENVDMVDLGDANLIDQEILVLRERITSEDVDGLNNKKSTFTQSIISTELESLLLKPLLNAVGDDCDSLYISPDGDLSLLPFEIIPYNLTFLMDYFEIIYLGTGRDLLRLNQDRGACSNPMLMVNPDFNYNNGLYEVESGSSVRSHLSRDFNRDEMNFKPLPGTRLEGENISKILDASNPYLLMSHEAVETRLKTLKSPWILHLATHGFFLPDQEPITPDSVGRSGGLRFTGTGMENPLIRSGLAFAGANTSREDLPDEAEDGIFTAEEASGLNLLNTELVVLSACETGLGKVKRGEGVFGLRRAFILAGARTLVMSLWIVDDLATTILMERFYKNMIENFMGRNKALKKAQICLRNVTIGELRENWLSEDFISQSSEDMKEYLNDLTTLPDDDKPFDHPYYWGAFICQGDPKPLDII